MKIFGIIVGSFGAVLFVWHLTKVFTDTERETGVFTHHWLSLFGGILMLVGVSIYIVRRHKKSG